MRILAAGLIGAVGLWAQIDIGRVTAHVKTLASDAFEGRSPGTAGEKKTVEYLIKQFETAGVKPGGGPDGKGGRTWVQSVPLAEAEFAGPVSVRVTTGEKVRSLSQGEEIAVRATFHAVDQVTVDKAPLVFVGYGVNAPERNWDDYKGFDLKGKVGVVLINDPDFETDLGGRFGGKAMTYYGRWTYKFEEAARRGAAGMIVVHETAPASYGWATVRNSNTEAMFDIVRTRPGDVHPLLEGWIQRSVAAELFAAAGLNFEAEKKRAQTADFRPVPLGNSTLSLSYAAKHSEVISQNVVGILEGSTHPEETVLYTAHWDHLGVGQPDANGDRIYNGARDNALGVAGLLELARLYGKGPKTERSVVFLAFTAEERGLLGSEYYAQHPVFPLALTAGVYNMDGGSTAGPTRDVAVAGDGKVTLQDDLAKAAVKAKRTMSPDPRPEAGSFFRSDHFSLAKVGVPAISFRVGLDLVNGGVAAGKAYSDEYTAKRYHQPADEWSDKWDLRGMAEDTGLLYDIGRELANSRRWPGWLEGSEFRAIREQSAAERK